MDIVKQNKESVHCELLTDSRKTVETTVNTVTQNQQTVQCELLTDNIQNVGNNNGYSDTEPTEDTACGTEIHWIYSSIYRNTVADSSVHSDTEPTDGTV